MTPSIRIPKDRTISYGRIVVNYRPHKDDPNRCRITYGGNIFNKDGYPGELTTRTADLTTTKILWNSVISTRHAKYMCTDISHFYLNAPLERYEYMLMSLKIFPQHIIDQYDLTTHAKGGVVYLEIQTSIYGLPAMGAIFSAL